MPNATRKQPRELLNEAAARLKRQWPGMSARAVAAKLKITPSYWSKVLRGKKPITQALLPRLIKVLGLDAQQVAQLQRAVLDSIESEQLTPATGIRTRGVEKESPAEEYRNLGRQDFWMLKDWFYIPILNLFTLTNFLPTSQVIADRLGISPAQAEQAVLRLQESGFLRKGEGDRLERTDQKIRFPTDRSFREVRDYQLAMLSKAQEELRTHMGEKHFQQRLISSVCLAGSTKKLNEARLILEEAMYRAANLMADEPMADEVYQINFQLFPLTRSDK